MPRFTVYDSQAVDLIVCALPIIDGRAEEFVKVAPDEEAFGTVKGADGHVCRFATHNTLYTVEVNLLGSSSENAKLAALHALDVNTPNGAGVGAFLLKDANGSTILAGTKCWIEKAPDGAFGKQRPDVTWTIKVVSNPAAMIVGGN